MRPGAKNAKSIPTIEVRHAKQRRCESDFKSDLYRRRATHLLLITHQFYIKEWVKPDADAGSKFEADPHFAAQYKL